MYIYKSGNRKVEHPMPVERVPEGHKPYDWKTRKDRVMTRMKRVKSWVLPFGSTEPWEMRMTDGDKARELSWLIKTQYMELAPMWEEFAANGIRAQSMHAPEDDMDDWGEFDEECKNHTMALAQMYNEGRREEFAKQTDYQSWHTEPPRKAIEFEKNGKRAIKPMGDSEFTLEELLAMLSHPQPERPEEITYEWQDILDWLNELDKDPAREAFRILDEELRYAEDKNLNYAAGEPCPSRDVVLRGYPACADGKAPTFLPGRTGVEFAGWAECPVCAGTGQVQNILGTTLAITD